MKTAELKQSKFKQKVYHEKENKEWTGRTLAAVIHEGFVGVGISLCHPEHDQFNRKLGFKISTNRAHHAIDMAYTHHKTRPETKFNKSGEPLYFSFDLKNPPLDLLKQANIPEWLWKEVK